MEEKDYYLFQAACLIIRTKEQKIIRLEQSVSNLTSFIGKYKGQKKLQKGVKDQIKKIEKQLDEMDEEIKKTEAELPKYMKVYEEINEKYFK